VPFRRVAIFFKERNKEGIEEGQAKRKVWVEDRGRKNTHARHTSASRSLGEKNSLPPSFRPLFLPSPAFNSPSEAGKIIFMDCIDCGFVFLDVPKVSLCACRSKREKAHKEKTWIIA
jgi:hypothetical protein